MREALLKTALNRLTTLQHEALAYLARHESVA
jgi:hypothetical protein